MAKPTAKPKAKTAKGKQPAAGAAKPKLKSVARAKVSTRPAPTSAVRVRSHPTVAWLLTRYTTVLRDLGQLSRQGSFRPAPQPVAPNTLNILSGLLGEE